MTRESITLPQSLLLLESLESLDYDGTHQKPAILRGKELVNGMEGLIPIKQAAQELGISPITLQRQALAGVLKATKLGRDWFVTPAEVERYRAEHLGRVGRRKKQQGKD